MGFINKIKETIAKYSMLSDGDTVIVGLSGGADSVTLLYCLRELAMGLTLYAVYIDHGLRPVETPREIEFCANLCYTIGVSFCAEQISLPPKITSNSQDTLRELRYEILERIAYERKAARIAMGHNKDDQAETVLLHFIRGSALSGLGGIPPVRGKIIRPLIDTTRADIEKYIDSIDATNSGGLKFVTDSSNLTQKYTRNKVRHSLLPVLKQYNPNIVDTLTRNADIIRDENTYMERLSIKKTMTLISRRTDRTVELFLLPLQTLEKTIQRRVLKTALGSVDSLKGIGAIHIDDIIELVKHAPTGASIDLPRGIRAIKGYSLVTITTEEQTCAPINTYTLETPGELIIKEAGVVVRASLAEAGQGAPNRLSVIVDADRLENPLTVRGRSDGDYFYPMGFGKRKKVQDFFVDEKVPKNARDGVPLVFSGDELVWIAGIRGDERFTPGQQTRRFLRLELLQIKT
ncbi:MAG: tRNA lysidine(34) synthetase TilS [Nitrospirae bacterium]|nr:tRNA lysidine(34) synthetase TilS [Nitrospirota bacterium]